MVADRPLYLLKSNINTWSTSRLTLTPTYFHFWFRPSRFVDGRSAFRDVGILSGVAYKRLQSRRVYTSIYIYRLRCSLFTWGHSEQWDTSEKRSRSQLVQSISLKFCTRVVGDKAHKLRRQNFEFRPLKIWPTFEFFAYIVSYGMKT